MNAAGLFYLLFLASVTLCTAAFGITGCLLYVGLACVSAGLAWTAYKRTLSPEARYAKHYRADYRATRRSEEFCKRRRDES